MPVSKYSSAVGKAELSLARLPAWKFSFANSIWASRVVMTVRPLLS